MSTSQFKVLFRRYRTKGGESRISTPQWMNAESFGAVVGIAQYMLAAMAGADPESNFTIYSVEAVGARGIECDGALMWETGDELSARVGAEVR